MANDRKRLLLIIAEPRSTFDFTFIGKGIGSDKGFGYIQELIYNSLLELNEKIAESKELLEADTAILASATPLSINYDNMLDDWVGKNVRSSWIDQSYAAEVHRLDENGNYVPVHEGLYMGKCFYPEGYATLSKENGFGNWKMVKTMQPGIVAEKTAEYVRELSQTYDIVRIIVINDFGYSEPIIDAKALAKEFGISIDFFVPAKPWCGPITIGTWSNETCINGVLDCFSKYNKKRGGR